MIDVTELQFPVLRFVRGRIFPARTPEDLTTATKTALARGFFQDQVLVDSSGARVRVKGAKKLHGLGAFWGYNIFLNQRIKVALFISGTEGPLSLDEVKALVLKALYTDDRWSDGDSRSQLEKTARMARSIRELATVIADAYFEVYPVR